MIGLKHLKCLSAIQSNSGIGFLTPAAYPGKHCPMHTALALGARIRGLSTLVVGTPECAVYSRNVFYSEETDSQSLHFSYVLDAKEVVFGFRDGLVKALYAMERAGAKAILVITTCVPEVIGEDLEGILWELKSSISSKIIHVSMGHFKCNSYPSGYWKTLAALGGIMMPVKQTSKIINILGRSPKEEAPEPVLLSALKQAGYQLRMLGPKSDLEDFISAPDAKLNLVLSPFMNPLAEWMEKQYKLPFFSLHDVYEIFEIDCMYQKIGEFLQIQWNALFEPDRQKALSLQEKGKELFQGVNYVMTSTGAMDSLPLAFYLTELHMRPVLIHIEEFYPADRMWGSKITGKGYDPVVCHMVNDQEDIRVIEYLCPDFHIGELHGLSGIPEMTLIEDLYGMCGYERTSLLLLRMLSAYGGE